MSQENAVFSFELNESLYFEPGQEVSEILGISLDPEISIQPFNDYISIRGVIELSGEYQRVNESWEREDSSYNLDDYSSRRYVEQVRESDQGEATFSHRFPVEISVPTYRVKNLNDVTVSVDHFDYELPDQNLLRLTSIIAIQGINDIVDHTEETDEAEEEYEELEETFRFDIKEKHKTDDSDEEQLDNVEEFSRESNVLQSSNDSENDDLPREEQLERAPVSSVKSSQDGKSEEEDVNKTDYLSNMFEKEEERYAKMRLCIVQENDTLSAIAERYEVNPLQISKRNNLEGETLLEGQLLYIPVKQ